MISDLEYYRVKDNVNSYYRIESESKRELLLNKYPNAAAAYSLRLLDGYYRGPLVRVRREDGIEVDVYPDYNNEVSLDSLVTNVNPHTTDDGIEDQDYTFVLVLQSFGEFVGHAGYSSTLESPSTATVCVWYDQSKGNDFDSANNAKQTAADNQPKIYDSSTGVLTKNGKPAVTYTSGTGIMLQSANFASALSQPTTWFAVGASNNTGDEFMFSGGNVSTDSQAFGTRTTTFQITAGTQINTTTSMDANQHVWSIVFNGASSNAWQDGSQVVTNINAGSNGITRMTIFNLAYSPTLPWEGAIQEIVLYPDNQTSNRGGIEQDINDHYQIEGYTPPEPLLDEFDGAAAAYSLRKLRSSYTGPLVRVRRDSATGGDDVEVDVYPDENGGFSLLSPITDGGNELSLPYNGGTSAGSTDKNTLYEFVYGQSCDLMVVVWYDQSGNGNDATQTTTTYQPKIYDSVSGVIEEGSAGNEKPAIDFQNTLAHHLSFVTSDLSGKYPDLFTVLTVDVYSLLGAMMLSQTTSGNFYTQLGSIDKFFVQGSATNGTGIAVNDSQQRLIEQYADGTDIYTSYDGTQYSHSISTSAYPSGQLTFRIGQHSDTRWNLDGRLQEFILWSDNQTGTNRSGIETNINDYYNIY